MTKISIALLALVSMTSVEAYADSRITLPDGKVVNNIERSITTGNFIGVKYALVGYLQDQKNLGSVDRNRVSLAIKAGDTYVPLDETNWNRYAARASNAEFALSTDGGSTWAKTVRIRPN